MLIDGLESCGLLVDYCVVFISCLDSHSDGTHSLQRIHWCASDGMLHFYDEETNSYVTHAVKMSRNAQGLILSYRQKKGKMLILVEFQVFTKMSSLSPHLVIPMLQI